MKLPKFKKPKIRNIFLLFVVQMIQYCIVSISYIALNKGQYGMTFITDIIYGFNSFFIIKKIVDTEHTIGWDAIAYTLGGAVGSMLAIFITKHFVG